MVNKAAAVRERVYKRWEEDQLYVVSSAKEWGEKQLKKIKKEWSERS